MRTTLVTGASGTVGSVVAATLGARGLVRTPASPGRADQVVGDLADARSLAAAVAGVEVVVHAAAALASDWATCERTNVEGTAHLLDAMRGAGCELLVHISTVSVYDHRVGVTLDEACPRWTERVDAYGFTKAEAERLVEASGVPYVILRPVVVLSSHPRSYWGACAVDRARTSPHPVWPLAEVPHVHVDNLAAAVGLAIRNPAARGRAYNVVDGIGDGRAFNERLFRAAGRTLPEVAYPPFRLDVRGDRIRAELGYAPPDRFAEVLDQLAP